MSNRQHQRKQFKNLTILGMIWLLGAVCDRIWLGLDNSIPAWDQADYLTGTLTYWQALQNPQWWDSQWWQNFWMLSSKIPPLTYIIGAIVQNIFGTGPDQAALVMLLFSAILLGSVYGLGTVLFNGTVGLWAAALCQVMPALYRLRLDFLLDYPLAAVVTFSFFCCTVWRVKRSQCVAEVSSVVAPGVQESRVKDFPHSPHSPTPHPLPWALAFGLSLGLALMVKQTALFFLLTPIVWVGFGALRQLRCGQLLQLLAALCLSILILSPWYSTNWLLILTSGKRATLDSAIAEGDAPLHTLQAWIYYWQQLPKQVSLPLLVVPIFALLLYWGLSLGNTDKRRRSNTDKTKIPASSFPASPRPPVPASPSSSLQWLTIFLIGAYFLSSLNPNKDERYVLPYLPTISVFLAYGITRYRGLWGRRIRWGTLGLAMLLMLFNLFPIGGFVGSWMTSNLSPNAQHYPDLKEELPHRQIIAQIIATEPYLRSTLGVLPSTTKINQHNLNYYGALANFQVYGRQVGIRKKFVQQDTRSLSWFLTKNGKQGSVPKAQPMIVETVEQGGNFQLNKSWISGSSIINLYHQQTPPVEVKLVSQPPAKIALQQVTVPEKAPPGAPVSVTYEWTGTWEELQNGIVLLTWRHSADDKMSWIHDHGIGMGNLYTGAKKPEGTLQVTERMAMLTPANLAAGNYTLEAIYLNRVSGESYEIPVPEVTLQIDPQATATTASELDLVTQIRVSAATLPEGTKALEQLFEEVGRINQYDPIQDYLEQARLSLEYRLKHFSQNRDWAYALALANVLEQRVNDAIAALEKVTQLDSENPYAWAYLAFVQLYNWQPKAAEASLQPSLAKNPHSPEIQALNGVAALMQGKVMKAWQTLRELTRVSK